MAAPGAPHPGVDPWMTQGTQGPHLRSPQGDPSTWKPSSTMASLRRPHGSPSALPLCFPPGICILLCSHDLIHFLILAWVFTPRQVPTEDPKVTMRKLEFQRSLPASSTSSSLSVSCEARNQTTEAAENFEKLAASAASFTGGAFATFFSSWQAAGAA